jgi:hypothetical protein
MPRSSKDNEPPWRFHGVTSPNTTQVPDQYLDELLSRLSGAELKVLLYITRRTFGFKKDSDNISLSQLLTGIRTRDGRILDHGTGLSKKTLLQALTSLQEMNIVFAERRQSDERGNEPTTYRLNILSEPPGVKTTPPLGEKVHQGGGGEIPPSPRGKNSPTQQTVLQETVKQHDDDDVASALRNAGINATQARRLAGAYPQAVIYDKIELVEYLKSTRSSLISRNPQGFLIRAIEEAYSAPEGYKSKTVREREAKQRQEFEAELAQAEANRRDAIKAMKANQPAKKIAGTTFTTKSLWQQVQPILQGKTNTHLFDIVLKDSVLLDYARGMATIGVPYQFFKEQLEPHHSVVAAALSQVLDRSVKVEFAVVKEMAADESPDPKQPRTRRPRGQNDPMSTFGS